jgi:hypothetical protein
MSIMRMFLEVGVDPTKVFVDEVDTVDGAGVLLD